MLNFTFGNAKLNKDTAIFSLPAGHSCPFASLCLSKADKVTGKITDGPKIEFRCYAASNEAIFRTTRDSRWHNFDSLRGKSAFEMYEVITKSLPKKDLIRIHASGDFFSQAYFDAWVMVAQQNPNKTFYAYTKALPFWVARLNQIPNNLKLTASIGGKSDALIYQYDLKFVQVVFSKAEAKKLKLKIDHDDTLAWKQDKSFAILLHGTQPAGTTAAKAWSKLKEISGYSKGDYWGGRNRKKNLTVAA